MDFSDRHSSTQHMMKMLEPNPNLPTPLFEMAEEFQVLAFKMIGRLKDSPELTEGLRKLWEAKNSLVASAVLFND